MKKRVFAYLLTGLTVLAVTGCSGNAVKNADSEENRPAESESVNGETFRKQQMQMKKLRIWRQPREIQTAVKPRN